MKKVGQKALQRLRRLLACYQQPRFAHKIFNFAGTLSDFSCSAKMNSTCAKVLLCKTLGTKGCQKAQKSLRRLVLHSRYFISFHSAKKPALFDTRLAFSFSVFDYRRNPSRIFSSACSAVRPRVMSLVICSPAILPMAASWMRVASTWLQVISGMERTLLCSMMMASQDTWPKHSASPWTLG